MRFREQADSDQIEYKIGLFDTTSQSGAAIGAAIVSFNALYGHRTHGIVSLGLFLEPHKIYFYVIPYVDS